MNALNLLSARLIGPTPSNAPASSSVPSDARELAKTRSWFWAQQTGRRRANGRKGKDGSSARAANGQSPDDTERTHVEIEDSGDTPGSVSLFDGESPAEERGEEEEEEKESRFSIIKAQRRPGIPRQLADALVASIKWLLSTLAAPGVYVVACMSDDQGRFSPLLPIRRLYGLVVGRWWRTKTTTQTVGLSPMSDRGRPRLGERRRTRYPLPRLQSGTPQDTDSEPSPDSRSTSTTTEDEPGRTVADTEDRDDEGAQHPSWIRSGSELSDEGLSGRRNIRIKASKEDARKRRKSRKTDSTGSRNNDAAETTTTTWLEPPTPLTPATLKSPTSPVSSLGMTKYPRIADPPRPLVPPRRPSNHLSTSIALDPPSKTLVLDLDETLIHSLAKGGRMGTGHMVEVKLNTTITAGGGAVLGPQHPILYYVHKRPHCDDFLRKVNIEHLGQTAHSL